MTDDSSDTVEIDLRDSDRHPTCRACHVAVEAVIIRRHSQGTLTVLIPCGHSTNGGPRRDVAASVRSLVSQT